MADFQQMVEAAAGALRHVLDLHQDDRVLVVTDEATRRVGEAFRTAAADFGCKTDLTLLPEPDRPLQDVPEALSSQLAQTTVVVNAFRADGRETPFRIKWIFEVEQPKNIRLGHAPGITEAMMTGGPMNVDYALLQVSAESLIAAFDGAVSVHITTPAGTDLNLDIKNRAFQHDTRITNEVAGNLPCGEIYCAPVENGADGILVIDGTIGDIGPVSRPLRITLAAGTIQEMTSEDSDLVREVEKLSSLDREARVIGELGIGLNPGARLTGNMLEDEKAFRTAHIAFGNNEEMPGGRNRSRTHRDFLFHRPTFTVTFKSGSHRTLILDGDLQI